MSQLRDLTPPPSFVDPRVDRSQRRRPKRKRTFVPMLVGALAMYGAFSLVLHAVVAWEMTH